VDEENQTRAGADFLLMIRWLALYALRRFSPLIKTISGVHIP
jgi:hypothetical protein